MLFPKFRFSIVHNLLLITALLPSFASAQQNSKLREQSSVERPGSTLTPEVGPVRRAQSLLGKRVISKEGYVAGTIDDLVLDLDTGYVAVLLILPSDNVAEQTQANESAWSKIAAPGTIFKVKGDTVSASTLPKELFTTAPKVPSDATATAFTRTWVTSVYLHYQTDPPWHQSDRNDKNTAPLSPLSTLKNQPVTRADDTDLGHVKDFAIAINSAQIAYAALSLNEKDQPKELLYPIPLSAYVVMPGKKSWILELPDKIVENASTFNERKWPTEINRGWVEYVHVRYGGGGVFSGVQRTLHQPGGKAH